MTAIIGYLFANIPIIVPVLICAMFPPATYLKIFVPYYLLLALNDAILHQTAFWIATRTYPSQRCRIESYILNGSATIGQRLFFIFLGFYGELTNFAHIFNCLIVSAVIFGIFKLIDYFF